METTTSCHRHRYTAGRGTLTHSDTGSSSSSSGGERGRREREKAEMQSTETQAFVTEAQRTDAARPPRVRIIDNANMRDADTEMPMRYGHCVSDRVEMRAVLGLFALFYCLTISLNLLCFLCGISWDFSLLALFRPHSISYYAVQHSSRKQFASRQDPGIGRGG